MGETPLTGTYIPKGTPARVCSCGVVTYRLYRWSDTSERHEPTVYDCEQPGSLRPKQRIGGAGHEHVCKKVAA